MVRKPGFPERTGGKGVRPKPRQYSKRDISSIGGFFGEMPDRNVRARFVTVLETLHRRINMYGRLFSTEVCFPEMKDLNVVEFCSPNEISCTTISQHDWRGRVVKIEEWLETISLPESCARNPCGAPFIYGCNKKDRDVK